MTQPKRKWFYLYCVLAAGLAISALVTGGIDGKQGLFADESDYSISFDKTTNKIGTETFVSPSTVYSGTGTVLTGRGTNIGFEYNSFSNPTTIWQLIKGGGYFTNTEKISGMKNITLTKTNSSSSLKVYWSETKTFDETKSATYDTTSALSFTCDFTGYSPNYIKVLALGTGNSAITSGKITFSCANQYPTLTLTADHSTMGSVTGGGVYKIGSNITITATPNTGYQFVGWYNGSTLLSTEASYTFTMPECVDNYDVEGRFVANSYNVVLSSEDETKGTVSGSGTYDYASTVSISATAESGYSFAGWYNGTTLVSSDNPYSFTMPNNSLDYIAKFSANSYNVSLTCNSAMGYVSGSGSHTYKTSVTIRATAYTGYSFAGWYQDNNLIASSNSYTFEMPYEAVSYEARFATNSYTITLSSSEVATTPVGTCGVSGAGTYDYKANVTLSATPQDGYGFIGWYNGNTLVSSNNPYSFTMPSNNISYVAKYAKKYHVSVSSYDETKGTVYGSGDYIYTSNVKVTATPIDPYTGVTWYDDSFASVSINTAYSFSMPENDLNLSADFTLQCTITFKNSDGSTLQTGKYNIGVIPYYNGTTPTKAAPLKSIYTFSGWSPEITAVTEDKVYIAQYTISQTTTLGMSFTLGKYPQTVVEDSTLLTALASATDTDSDGYLEYGSDEYKKVDSADPWDTGYKSASGNVTFATGTTYYFRVEPIQWRVLSGQASKTGLVMAENVLTNSAYYTSASNRSVSGSTVYPNNYQYSTLRAMLNGYNGSAYSVANFSGKGFLDVAFTATEKAYITTTTVDNSAATTGSSSNSYACANTSDRIFALSYRNLTNASYGILTDYARATGASMYTDSSYYGNGDWWSRSPFAGHSDCAWFVDCVGYLLGSSVDFSPFGVRPSFNVDIS